MSYIDICDYWNIYQYEYKLSHTRDIGEFFDNCVLTHDLIADRTDRDLEKILAKKWKERR